MVALTAIDLADAVEAGERQHDAAVRHAAADEARIAALRHDRHAGLGAGRTVKATSCVSAGPHDRRGAAPVEAARLHQPARDVRLGGHHVLGGRAARRSVSMQRLGRITGDRHRASCPRGTHRALVRVVRKVRCAPAEASLPDWAEWRLPATLRSPLAFFSALAVTQSRCGPEAAAKEPHLTGGPVITREHHELHSNRQSCPPRHHPRHRRRGRPGQDREDRHGRRLCAVELHRSRRQARRLRNRPGATTCAPA